MDFDVTKVQPMEKTQNVKAIEKTASATENAVAKVKEPTEKEKPRDFTEREIESTVKAVNEKLAPVGRSFEYKMHDVTKQVMIKIKDANTGEVIKEIPPEKGQDAVAKLWELAGILVDEKR